MVPPPGYDRDPGRRWQLVGEEPCEQCGQRQRDCRVAEFDLQALALQAVVAQFRGCEPRFTKFTTSPSRIMAPQSYSFSRTPTSCSAVDTPSVELRLIAP